MHFRKGRHSVSVLSVHLVFIVEYRRDLLDDHAIAFLAKHFAKVCDGLDCDLLACDGEGDHIHALVEYPPKLAVSVLVNSLKGSSSRMLRKERPDLARRLWKGVLWTPAYFAGSTGGAPLEAVRAYVEQQRASSPT